MSVERISRVSTLFKYAFMANCKLWNMPKNDQEELFKLIKELSKLNPRAYKTKRKQEETESKIIKCEDAISQIIFRYPNLSVFFRRENYLTPVESVTFIDWNDENFVKDFRHFIETDKNHTSIVGSFVEFIKNTEIGISNYRFCIAIDLKNFN